MPQSELKTLRLLSQCHSGVPLFARAFAGLETGEARMPNPSLPADVINLPDTLLKFREHAQKGNYALAQRYHEQVTKSVADRLI